MAPPLITITFVCLVLLLQVHLLRSQNCVTDDGGGDRLKELFELADVTKSTITLCANSTFVFNDDRIDVTDKFIELKCEQAGTCTISDVEDDREENTCLFFGAPLQLEIDGILFLESGTTFCLNGGKTEIRNSTFRDCISNKAGGTLRATGSDAVMIVQDCVFENNLGLLLGGALSLKDGATGTIQRCTFQNNRALANGGAIYINGDDTTVQIQDSSFQSNQAVINGGAVYITGAGSFANITNSEFVKNTATALGGGIFLTSYISISLIRLGAINQVEISKTKFTENEARTGGGAIGILLGGQVTLSTNTTFLNNQSKQGQADVHFKRISSRRRTQVTCMEGTNVTFCNGYSDNNGGIIINMDGRLSNCATAGIIGTPGEGFC